MNGIGWAVKQMQYGNAVRRAGWNGKGMFLVLVSGGSMNHPVIGRTLAKREAHEVECGPYVAMYTAQRNVVPWLCSQTDLLATDWEIAA